MKYMLKPKGWSLLDFLYDYHYGTTDRAIFFDNEEEVISFFRFTVEESVADATANINSWQGEDRLTVVMNLASKPVSFINAIKNNFHYFTVHCVLPSSEKTWYQSYSMKGNLKFNPKNYKLFVIEEKQVRNHKFKVVQHLTWNRFYKKCVSLGLTNEQLMLNNP
jgi:hypothetical protein